MSARCPTASTPSRCSRTCSWSCCRPRRSPRAAGAADPARIAWQAGLVATLCSGVIELALRRSSPSASAKATPRAALLSTLSGIALGFISLGFLFRTFARPIVGLTTLGIVMLTYFGRVRFKGRLPGGLVAVALGTLLSWVTGIAPVGDAPPPPVFHLPVPVVGDLVAALGGGHLLPYLSVIVAMGLFNVLGSLQNIESAEAAGDAYETRRRWRSTASGSIAAALFGSAFPTTIYIGHPGWKAHGRARGLLGAQRRVHHDHLRDRHAGVDRLGGADRRRHGDRAVDRHRHQRAGVPGDAARARAGRRRRPAARHRRVGRADGEERAASAAGMGTAGRPFSEALIGEFQKSDTWIHGAFSLEQGFMFTSMLLSAAVVGVIERKWTVAAAWCAAAAAISATGLMHSYQWTMADTVLKLSPAWPFAIAYAVMAVILFSARWTTEPNEGHSVADFRLELLRGTSRAGHQRRQRPCLETLP